MGGRGEGTISSILKRKKKVEIICSRLHSLSDPCSFCPVRVCRGMECRELVAQVTEDSPNWVGEANQRLEIAGSCYHSLAVKMEGEAVTPFRSWHLLRPVPQETLLQKGGGNTTHPPHHLLPMLRTGQTQPDAVYPGSQQTFLLHQQIRLKAGSPLEADRPRSAPGRLF